MTLPLKILLWALAAAAVLLLALRLWRDDRETERHLREIARKVDGQDPDGPRQPGRRPDSDSGGHSEAG